MIVTARKTHPSEGDYRCISDCADLARCSIEFFDAAIATWVDCVIGERDELACIMDSISRVFRPGGTLFVMDSNWDDGNGIKFASIQLNHCGDLRSGESVKVTFNSSPPIDVTNWYWATDNLINLFRSEGFENISVEKPLAELGDPVLTVEQRISPVRIIHGRKPS